MRQSRTAMWIGPGKRCACWSPGRSRISVRNSLLRLTSLFTVSCGIALLQVAANPYVAVIGPPESSESRLTLVQAFNTTGDVLAIVFGQQLILARTTAGTIAQGTQLTQAQRMSDAQAT